MLAIVLAAAVAVPTPGRLRSFGNWVAGCDNGGACEIVALAFERTGGRPALMLVVRRAGSAAPASLTVPIDRAVAAGTRLTLSIDGKPVASIVAPGGGDGLALPLGPALATPLGKGRAVALLDARGRPIARASLTGLGPALRFVADEQRRAAPLPLVAEAAASDRKPKALKPRQIAALTAAPVTCSEAASVPHAPVRLDAGHTLLAIDQICPGPAGARETALFVVDEKGRAAPAFLDAPAGPEGAPAHVASAAAWNVATRRLTTERRDRPEGDCGRTQTFAWDGERFRLVAQAEMQPCRGVAAFIPTWRAEVAR